MATFKALVFSHQKHQDGTYNVKVRVTHNRKSRWLPTSLTAYKTDLTRDLKIKTNSGLADKCNLLIAQMRNTLSSLSPVDIDSMNVDQIVNRINKGMSTNAEFSLDFISYCYEFIDKWVSQESRKNYTSAVHAFERYVGPRIEINEISKKTIVGFRDFLREEPKLTKSKGGGVKPSAVKKKGDVTPRNYIKCLSRMFESAKEMYNDEDENRYLIPKSPFNNINFERIIHTGQKNLGIDMIQRVISYSEPVPERVRLAIDLFIVSFALMGMNGADLIEAPLPQDGILIYFRKKTRERKADRSEMHVMIPDEISPILSRIADPEEKMLINPSLIHGTPFSFLSNMSTYLSDWSQKTFGERFSLNAARHSWPSIARSIGVPKAVADECLTHASMKLADVYIDKDWNIFFAAQRKVLDIFTW